MFKTVVEISAPRQTGKAVIGQISDLPVDRTTTNQAMSRVLTNSAVDDLLQATLETLLTKPQSTTFGNQRSSSRTIGLIQRN